MVMSLTAWSATVDDLVAIDKDWTFIADDVTSNGTVGLDANTLYTGDRILSLGGNDKATNKGSNTIAGVSHLNSLRIKNAQNSLAFKVSGACAVTFYTQSHVERGLFISKAANVTSAESAYATEPYSTSVWNVNLDEAGVYYITSNGDLFIAGFEVVFPDDPAAVAFGVARTIDTETSTSSDTKEGEIITGKYRVHADELVDPSVAGVTIGKNYGTQDGMVDKSRPLYWWNGTETKNCYVDKQDKNYRNKVSNVDKTTLDENCYFGFDLEVEDGYKLSLVRINSDVLKDANSTHYQIKVFNNDNLIKTLEDVVCTNYNTSDMRRSVKVAYDDDLQNMTGTITLKMYFWNTGSAKYVAIKDFNVTAVVHEIESQTKTLKRIDVNGVQYDYENEGNTISTLLHAAPSVKFYYDVVNNWSDGSETAAPDEEETVVASVDGGNYVATTTLASTPYSLTFTNVDLPKVFGITRAVASETSNSTDMESDGVTPKTQNKYAISADALVDPSVAHVTITQNYGGRNALTNSSRSFVWFNGSEAQDCFVDYGELSDRTSSGDFNENQYFGFDMTVDLGYKVSLTELVSDALIEKDKTGVHYLVKIYNNDVEVASMPDVEVISKGVNMKRVIDLSENAALQDLTGKVTVKMFIYGNQGKYIIVKDLSVAAAVETSLGEGINTLSFADFTPAKEPEFTNGEVTATWKMTNSGGNVGPQADSKGIRMQGSYGYQMKLTVPEDSYISSVVFVWNKNGNYYSGDENPKRIIDMHITNSVGTEVSTLVYTGSKVNETEWTCGDLRESELTFAQGVGGDIYVNSIRVTYNKLDGEVSKSYTRTHTHMNLNTLCFPYTVTAYSGGTFYTMLYKRLEGSTPVEVVLIEHEGNLVAGTPYFYMPEGSQLELTYSGHRENTPSKVNGVQGIYEQQTVSGADIYVTYQGALRAVGSNVTLKEYRAYIIMDEVADEAAASAPAPGKKLLRIHNADAPAVITDIDQITNDKSQITNKILRNGQLFIIRDGKTYNAQGQMVK